jgi:hypothetical protein
MISLEQCKHVIQYYLMKMMSEEQIPVAPHVQRDCLYMNKMRGEICANISINPRMARILKLLHTATTINQVNSIPVDNKCFIDNKIIPKSSAGIQLIIHSEDTMEHICIRKKYQALCYAYFKLRHFPSFIEFNVKRWLVDQDWYIPRTYSTEYITDKILNSQFPNAIHTQLVNIVDTLT